jgi:hypothetical protein
VEEKMNKSISAITGILASISATGIAVADDFEMSASGGVSEMVDYGVSLKELFMNWGVALGWIIVAAIGFAFATGLSIKVFDLLTTNIDEWEEIKKGNMAMAIILVAVVVMMGLIIHKII